MTAQIGVFVNQTIGDLRMGMSPDLKSKAQQVNGYTVFPGKVLQGPSEEGLSEEEAREPEHVGFIPVIPVLQMHRIKQSDGCVIKLKSIK